MKKTLLVSILLAISLSTANAGKLDVAKAIGKWLKDKAGWVIGAGGLLGPELVSAAGYEDDDYSPASEDIEDAIDKCRITYTYTFTFCTSKNGDEVAVSNDVVSCHDGSTPRDGITIDLSKLLKDKGC